MVEPRGAPRLSIDRLSVRRGRRLIVDEVSFSAHAGGITALLGPNGAGKSTILKAIAGLLPHDGRVLIDGEHATTLDRATRARRVAYVPQHSALEAPLPVRDVVAQGRFAHGATGPWAARRDDGAVQAALAKTNTQALADRAFSTLSYGERRRVLLARALATGAPLLLLDEPTAALDVAHALALLKLLRTLASEGTAVLIVLHQLQEAVAVADQAVLLAEGRCTHAGPAVEVIAPAPVRAVYGVELVPDAQFACRLPGEDGR